MSERSERMEITSTALLADAVRVIRLLCDHLPDAEQTGECWDWCWNELNDEAQEAVKNARGEAEAFLSANKKISRKETDQ